MRFTRTPISALILLLFAPSNPAYPNPVGEKLVAGAATFQRSTNALTVQQSTDRAIINWQGFSIGAGELTKFIQPSAASAVLNRVVSGNPSSLLGRLEANGKVFLINPNGILVGAGAVINTNAFIASTLDVSNAKFLAGGDLGFVGDSKAGILNLGSINAQGGDVFLIAHTVENAGSIAAPNGTVGLAAGTDVVLKHAGDDRLFVQSRVAGQPGTETGIANSGIVSAVQAELRAAGGNVYALAVNNSGAIHATGITEKDGRILLTSTGGNIENAGKLVARNANGDGGVVTVAAGQGGSAASSGVIDASGIAPGARGGQVSLTGERVALTGTALVDVSGAAGGGTALIGGDYQGSNPAIDNAQDVSVDKGVRIHADALTAGDGGKVIVWADQNTVFNGQISARGGATGGDGGLIETSGKVGLTVGQGARADAGAAAGKPGRWLLDPTNFTVVNGPGELDASGPPYTPTAANNTIGGADITAALQSGTDVEINTASAFAGEGNVTFTSNSFNALIAPGTSRATLRVIADNDITVSAALGGSNANNQYVVDFKAGRNITVSKATAFSGGFIGARNVTLTATTGSIFVNAAVHAVGEIIGGSLSGKDGNLTLNGTQGVGTANLSGSANTLLARGLLTVNSSSGGADLQGKTEAKEFTGKVNSNFIQSSGSAGISTNSTFISTLKDITSEGGRIDIDNFGSLAIAGAISAAGAKQNVSIRTVGDMSFLPGGSITTSATGTTTLTTLQFGSPAGNITSTAVGNTSPVIKGGGALVLRPLGSAGISATNPLFTSVGQLEAEPSFGGVFISNTGGTLFIGTDTAGRDPDAAALGVRVNTTTTSAISIVNEGTIQIQSPTGERVVGPGDVTLRAIGAKSDIFVANVNANGVTSRNGRVTIIAGNDVNIGQDINIATAARAGNVIGATGVDITADSFARVLSGSSIMAQGSGTVNITSKFMGVIDGDAAPTRIQTNGGAINLTTRPGGLIGIQGAAGGGLFTTLTAGKSGNIHLTADLLAIEGTIDAGVSNVTILPPTTNRPISIGLKVGGPDALTILDSDMDRIRAGQVNIGSDIPLAAIAVNQAISRPTAGPTYSALKLRTGTNLTIAAPIDIGSGDLFLGGANSNISGSGNINAFTVNFNNDGAAAAINLGGSITAAAALSAGSNGALTFSGPITTKTLDLRSLSSTINLSGAIAAALTVDASSVGNMTISGPVTTDRLTLSSSTGEINVNGFVNAPQQLAATSAGNMTFGGNVRSEAVNLTSTSGSIALNGNVTGVTSGAFSGSVFRASAPQGNVVATAPGNNIFEIAGVTYNREFQLNDSISNLTISGPVTAMGANATASIGADKGNLIIGSGTKFSFSGGGGTLNLSANGDNALGTGNINVNSPIDTGSGNLVLVASGNVQGFADITANQLTALSTTSVINLSGNIAAARKLTATSAAALTLSGNINTRELNLTSSSGAITLTGAVNTPSFTASAPGGNVIVDGANNNILTVLDVNYDREFRLSTSGLGLTIFGIVDGGPASSATIEVRNGALAFAPGAKFIFGGTGGVVKLFSDTSFENLAGTNALVPENGARWLIYTPSQEKTTLGGLLPDGREVYGIPFPAIPPNSGETAGNRVVHPIFDPFAANLSGPDLTAATGVGGYNTLNVLPGSPLGSLAGLALSNPEAAIASALSDARRELANLLDTGPQGVFFRARTDGALDATINAASRARELGLPYQIRAALPNSRDGDLIVARPLNAEGSLMTVIMDNGVIVNVPWGGRVVADGMGGIKVLGEEGAGLAATVITQGTGSVVIAGQMADSTIEDPGASIGYANSHRLNISAAIDRNVDAQLAAKFLKRITLPSGRSIKVSTLPAGLAAAQSGLGNNVSTDQVYAMAAASGLTPDDVSAIVNAGGGRLTPGVIAAMVAAGGGNMNGQRIASMVAAGGGNMVAAGGGNFLPANAVAQIMTAMVAAGAGNMVAAGGMNFGPQAIQALVAAGGMNLSAQRIAQLIGNDGGTLIGNDGSTLIGNDGGTLIGNDGSTLIGNDGGTLIGNDGGTLIGNDGGTLIGNDGGTLISRLTAGFVQNGGRLIGLDGGSLIGLDGGSLIGLDGGSLIGTRGGNVMGNIGAGSLVVNPGSFGGFIRPMQ